jgi:hypothetical protein
MRSGCRGFDLLRTRLVFRLIFAAIVSNDSVIFIVFHAGQAVDNGSVPETTRVNCIASAVYQIEVPFQPR